MLIKKYKQLIYLLLVIMWMLTVFIFSNQNGEMSQKTSNSITKIVVKVLTYNKNLTEESKNVLMTKTDYIIRKLAHFSIYMLGGMLIYNYINTYSIKPNKKLIISIIFGITYAITDELHQYFIAGRSSRILDVYIDSLGIIVGTIFINLINKTKSFDKC